MGMFYCEKCKRESRVSVCQRCGAAARKFWWTFPSTDANPNPTQGVKVYYNEDGSVDREEAY